MNGILNDVLAKENYPSLENIDLNLKYTFKLLRLPHNNGTCNYLNMF